MPSTDDALLDAAVALGVVDARHDLDPAFFEAPLATVGGMLRERPRREALLGAIDGLLEREDGDAAGAGSDVRRYPLLPDDLAGQLFLVARVGADAAVVLGLEGELAADAVVVGIDMPLVSASGQNRQPAMIAGSAEGPVSVRVVHEADGVTIELRASAWVDRGKPGGSVAVRLGGLTVDGAPVDDLELSTAELSDGAVDAVVRVVTLALRASGAGASDVVALLATHLPPVLGLDGDTGPPLPFTVLARDPGAFRVWLSDLARDQTRFRRWFGHVAGLLGDDAPAVPGALPDPSAPWTVTLLADPALPHLLVELTVEGTQGQQTLAVTGVVRLVWDGAPVAAEVRARLVELPLDAPAPARLLTGGTALVRAPTGEEPLLETSDAAVRAILAGLAWDATGVRPLLELRGVLLPGAHAPIERVDLSDADALAETAQTEVRAFLLDKLGAPGAVAAALVALVGLDAAAPALDLGLLAASPTRAVADLHRRAVLGGQWSTHHLPALATLLGASGSVTPGPGASTWSIRIAGDDSAALDVTAKTTVDGEQVTIEIGIAAAVVQALTAVADGPVAELLATVHLARFVIGAGGVTASLLLPAAEGALSIRGLDALIPDDVPLRAGSWTGSISWQQDHAARFAQRLSGVRLELPGDVDVDLGGLELPSALDPSAPDLGLGVAADAAARLVHHLVAIAIEAWRPDDDPVAAVLIGLAGRMVDTVTADLEGFVTDPVRVVGDVLALPAGTSGLLADDVLLLVSTAFSGWSGSGTPSDPWSRATGAEALLTALLARATGPRDPIDVAASWDPTELADRVARLEDLFATSDGLVAHDLDDPESLPDVIVPAAHADVLAHPAAVSELVDWLAAMRAADPGVPLVIVVPALLGRASAEPLLAVSGVSASVVVTELTPVPGGPDPLDPTAIVSGPAHLVVLDDARPEGLGVVLERLAALHAGHALGVVAASFAAPVAAQALGARPHVSVHLATVASTDDGPPAGADAPELVDAVRVLIGLGLPAGPARSALELVAALADGWREGPAGVPVPTLAPAAPAAGAGDPLVPELRIGGLTGAGLVELVAEVRSSAPQAAAPRSMVVGLAHDLLGPEAAAPAPGAPRVRADVRLDVVSAGAGGQAPAVTVGVRVDRPDGYLNVATPSGAGPTSAQATQVGALELELAADLARGTATVRIELLDVAVRGVHRATVTPSDPAFRTAIEVALGVLGSADRSSTRVRALLDWLEDGLALVQRAGSGVGLADQAVAALQSDPMAWLRARALAKLAAPEASTSARSTGLLGLRPDPTAPSGTTRWIWSPPDAPVRVVLTGSPWVLTVETTEPIPVAGPLAVEGTTAIELGAATTVDATLRIGDFTVHRRPDGTVVVDDPLLDAPAVLGAAQPPDAGEIARLARPLGAVLGARLLAWLLEQVTGGPAPDTRSLAAVLNDPAGSLHGALARAPEFVGEAALEIARTLGLPVSGTIVTLIPGVLVCDVATVAGRPAIGLGTDDELHPDPAVGLRLSAAVAVDAARHVHPSMRAALSIALPAAGTAWGSVGIRFTLDDAGPGVSLDLDGSEVQLVPNFAGLAALVGPTLTRLLPRTLDLLVAEIPDSDVKAAAIASARALDLYGTTFADAPHSFADLTIAYLTAHAAAVVPPVVEVLELAAGTSVPAGLIAATPDGRGVRIDAASVLGGPLSVDVVFDPPGVTVALTDARVGPVVAGLDVSATATPPALASSLHLGLDLHEAIGLTPRPTLRLAADSTGAASVSLEPLGSDHRADVLVTFVPTPDVDVTPTGGRLLVEHLLVLPGIHAVVLLLGDAATDALWEGGPSLLDLLAGAHLVDGGTVAASLPEPLDLLAGASSVLLAAAHVALSDDLDLGFGVPGVTVGPTLAGYVPFHAGDLELRLLLGEAGDPDEALAVDVLRTVSGAWQLAPRLRLRHAGLAALGAGGADLVNTDLVRIGGVAGAVGFDVDVDLSAGTPRFVVGGWRAGVALTGVSLPVFGGGNDSNPVAAGLLGSADGTATQPQFDLEVSWDGALHVTISGATPDSPVWFPIDRTFGPLHIARIGVQAGVADFAGSSLDFVAVLVEGGLSLGGLTVAVRGLGVRVPLVHLTAPEHWRFELDGLAVSYVNASVTIAGGLLKQGSGPTTQYLGMLQITVSGRGITALGGYGRTADGSPSLFAFVVINTPLGGPPYLFVTGLAGGFGFNRRLIVPTDPERVPSFPLMAALAGRLAGDPSTPDGAIAVLDDMARSIPPEKGAIWLAAGVKFTTFALLETNALLYVQFGRGFEIGLLGLMTARLPSPSNALVSVELALLARYSTVDNKLIARAQLTRNSWLFSENCRLTGGFAFVVWFGRPQAMLSIGGYHPAYAPPADYPQVPRVGFSWTPAKGVVVKGESYFTITPEAAMTGGRLEARAEVKGVGYGELVVYVDALLWFEPPRFVLDFGLRVSGRAFGFGFHVGASVHVELPPVFVRVHVDFLWGFDIEFGTRRAPPYLTYGQYTAKFLGDRAGVCSLAIAAGPAPGERGADPSTAGHTADNPLRVLPEFELLTVSKLPAVSATWAGQPVASAAAPPGWYRIVPMGPLFGPLRPAHHVTAVRVSDGVSVDGHLSATVEQTGVPAAVYWDDRRGAVPTQDSMRVDYADMTPLVSGIRLRSTSTVQAATGVSDVRVAALVDDLPDRSFPSLGATPSAAPPASARVVARRGAERPAGPAARPVRPSAAWASAAGPVDRRGATIDLAAPGGPGAPGLELWRTPGRWTVSTSTRARARQLDAAGRIVADGLCDRHGRTLDPRTELLAVQPADAGAPGPLPGLAGWQLHTRAHPVAPSAFLTRTAGIAVSQPVPLPGRRDPGVGVEMHRIVSGVETVVTDLPGGTTAVVVQLDRTGPGAEEDAATISCEAAEMALHERLPAGTDGRLHLVLAIAAAEHSTPAANGDGPRRAVAVHVAASSDGRPAWTVAGVVGAACSPAELAALVRAEPRADLVPDPEPGRAPAPRVRFREVTANG